VAETCVILSAITGVPLKQSLAVTGSMTQHGEVQPVRGVNEKIEALCKICQQAGGAAGQGALLPASNVEHLMLNEEVRDAVREGRFAIYPITRIDQAIELMTGMEAGEPDTEGNFPEYSFNRRVADRLAQFAAVSEKKESDQVTGNGGNGNGNNGQS